MTEVERDITKKVEEKKTVKNCDICSLTEVDIPDNEKIVDLKAGETTHVRYILEITPVDSILHEMSGFVATSETFTEEFKSIEEGKNYVKNFENDSEYQFNRKSIVSKEWDLNIDVCEHCISTLFGVNENMSIEKMPDRNDDRYKSSEPDTYLGRKMSRKSPFIRNKYI